MLPQHIVKPCLLLIASATLVLLAVTAHQATSLRDHIEHLVLAQASCAMQNTYEASWQSGGITITVKVTQETGETEADWAARFREAVKAAKAEFPADQ